MFSELTEAIKTHLATKVNAAPIQVDYYGNGMEVDLRQPAVLLDPLRLQTDPKDSRWRSGVFRIRLWILVAMVRDYISSMKEMEEILGADDQETLITGVQAALLQLRHDPDFAAMSGKIGGKAWRIRSGAIDLGDTTFGISMRSSERVNTAQVEISIRLDIEN